MKYSFLTLISIIITCIINPYERLYAQKDNNQDFINYLFKDYMGEKPSASIIVIKDGKIKKTQSFGYADLENKILASSKTNYRLGSATKQYTAMAILILIQKGKLDYETKLTEVIPEFPDYAKDITIKNLLSHRSGLKDYFKLYDKKREAQLDDIDVLNLLKKQDKLLFPANSTSRYSNSGYAILSLIVERISKKSFEQFMNDEIFQKTGMTNSRIYQKDTEIKDRAYGYRYITKDSVFKRNDQNITSAVKGDGGVYSSINDFYFWDKCLTDNSLISPDLKNDAFSNWDENWKNNEKGYSFGFGWLISFKNGIKYVWHTGNTIGSRSSVLRIPSENIAVAIYTNSQHNGRELKQGALALASLYSDNKLPMPIDVMIDKEISTNGSENIKEYYDKLVVDKSKYEINKRNLSMLAYSYSRKKESANCLNLCKFLTLQFPDYYGGFFELAEYYRINKNNEKAIENFKKVIELAPNTKKGPIKHSKKMIQKLSE